MLLKGSITWVQFIILFVGVKTYRLYRAAISKSFIEGITNSPTFPVCLIHKEFSARNNSAFTIFYSARYFYSYFLFSNRTIFPDRSPCHIRIIIVQDMDEKSGLSFPALVHDTAQLISERRLQLSLIKNIYKK
jgi:hypothetical protein